MVGILDAKYVSCNSRNNGDKTYYSISLVQDGDPMRFNATQQAYMKCGRFSLGDDIQLMLSIRQYNNSIYCSIEDVVV